MKIKHRQPKEVIQLWIEALESGEYTQGQNHLRTSENKFCCLGVLCDLAAKDGGAKWEPLDTRLYSYHGVRGVLPFKIKQYLKFTCDDISNLITLNDDEKASFKEIAKYIKSKILVRF